MLDIAGILFSSAMMLFIIVRAVQLDRIRPWFQPISHRDGGTKVPVRPWQRRG